MVLVKSLCSGNSRGPRHSVNISDWNLCQQIADIRQLSPDLSFTTIPGLTDSKDVIYYTANARRCPNAGVKYQLNL